MHKAQGLTRNPLGIIALFISLIYGFACLVLGFAGGQLTVCERQPLIWFLIGFPILILGSFVFLVVNHHKKLYAPSDYKDERNFFKGFESQQTHVGQKPNTAVKATDDAIDTMLQYGSVKGLYALYAAYLSKQYNVTFTLQHLEQHSSLLTEEYTHGFLVGASSMGAFVFSSQDQPFLITRMNERLENNIKDIVYKLAEREKQENNSDYLYNQLERIEQAFEKAKNE